MKAYARVGLELHSHLTSAVDGGGYQLHAPAALPSGREVEIFGWASEAVWRFWRKESFHLCGGSNYDLSVLQHVASKLYIK